MVACSMMVVVPDFSSLEERNERLALEERGSPAEGANEHNIAASPAILAIIKPEYRGGFKIAGGWFG